MPPCLPLARFSPLTRRDGSLGREQLPTSFVTSALPTKAEFEASLKLPDAERAKLERETVAAAEAARRASLAKAEAAAARESEDAAATAMQAAARGRVARTAVAAAAEAEAETETESYINKVVAEVVANAIEQVAESAPGEQGGVKVAKPGLLTRLSSALFGKKNKKASPAGAEAEVEVAVVEKRKGGSFSPSRKKKSKKTTADEEAPVEEEAPVVKFGFKVSDSGEVIIQMNLAKAEQPGSSS